MMKRSHKKGQVIVEWAIVLPLLMVTIFGICEWCLIEIAQNMTFDAAYKAARAELVHENPYDAAAITLLPIAGWTDTLYATGINGEEMEKISESAIEKDPDGNVIYDSEGKPKYSSNLVTIPNWNTPFTRSNRIVDRLHVELLDNNWDKVSYEVTFYYEFLFPFVDIFFADIQLQQAKITGVDPDENEQVGIANLYENQADNILISSATNFIELRANASVSRIDRPFFSSTTPFDPDNPRQFLGIETNLSEKPKLFDNQKDIADWTNAP